MDHCYSIDNYVRQIKKKQKKRRSSHKLTILRAYINFTMMKGITYYLYSWRSGCSLAFYSQSDILIWYSFELLSKINLTYVQSEISIKIREKKLNKHEFLHVAYTIYIHILQTTQIDDHLHDLTCKYAALMKIN